jgi:putative hydrolase of HD superfamily
MSAHSTPEAVVQQQLEAYNARNLDAWLATCAVDGRQFEFPAKLLATGHAELRERTAVRFQEPNLNARLLSRAVMGNIVIDHESVTRTFPEGTWSVDLVRIYEIRAGKIQTASFIFGERTLDPKS